jgi:tripartite-type tricarboxylate transporter receptor subunit TctC
MKRYAAALVALALALPAAAQEGPIKFLVGFPPGAGLDTMTRMIAEKMRVSLGQPVTVENRPGAAGQIAMNALKVAPPDGNLLVMTPLVTVVTAPHVFPKLQYDAFRDFAPVAHTADFLFAFVMGPATPAKDLQAYIALVKQDAKYGNYASAATGSLPHFFSLLFAEKAGLRMNHIGYKGTAAALTDLLGGQIASFMGTVSDVNAQHKAGKVHAVATSGAKRSRHMPDVPTFKELGFNIEGAGWYAAYAPAGTPAPVIERLSKAIIAGVNSPDVREKLDNYGMEPTGYGPAELARIHRRDYDQWGPVIKASGFKPGS